VKKFADDTKLGQIINGVDDVNELQQTLNGLCEWASRWGMAFNVQKCHVMHVGLPVTTVISGSKKWKMGARQGELPVQCCGRQGPPTISGAASLAVEWPTCGMACRSM
jgi:hypothetical protein